MRRILAAVTPDQASIKRFANESNLEDIVFSDGTNLPENAAGLLIHVPNHAPITIDVYDVANAALSAGIPILASATGMHSLNIAMLGDAPKETGVHDSSAEIETRRNPIFLAPGAKVSSMIGGSGWVSVECNHKNGITQAGLAPGLMPSAIAEDRVVEAFEMPGHHWIVGVQWDVFGANPLPRGFDAVWLAFIERVAGI